MGFSLVSHPSKNALFRDNDAGHSALTIHHVMEVVPFPPYYNAVSRVRS
jgi:hypothetical protein